MSDYAGDLSPRQAWDLLASDPDAVLVDVRTSAEWQWVGGADLSELGKRTLGIEWMTSALVRTSTRTASGSEASRSQAWRGDRSPA